MYPEILWTWSRGRQALGIGAHNISQNDGKRNLFSQDWSNNDVKKNMLQNFYDSFDFLYWFSWSYEMRF